jgi:signal transduction histidine kinase
MNSEIKMSEGDRKVIVFVDEDEFIQSMTNLIRNSLQAIKAREVDSDGVSFKGMVEVSIETLDNKIKIHVKDNGVGVEPDHRQRLFETQFSTKPREEGTGLGLNISRRFIRSFGGDIYLQDSELKVGTEFVVELPIHSKYPEEKVSA